MSRGPGLAEPTQSSSWRPADTIGVTPLKKVFLLQAGEYLLSAWSKDASTSRAEAKVTCKPGKTSPLHCRSDMSGLTNWRAGQPGKLSIIRKDRWRHISLSLNPTSLHALQAFTELYLHAYRHCWT